MKVLIRASAPEHLSGRDARRFEKRAISEQRWMEIPLDFDEFSAMTTVTEQFLTLRQFIPDKYHPVKIERA